MFVGYFYDSPKCHRSIIFNIESLILVLKFKTLKNQDYIRVSTSNDGTMVARALVTEENLHISQVSYLSV